jgi:hypothetical protein
VEPRRQRRRLDGGGLFIGGILLLVGVYYLFQQTLGFDLPDLNWNQMWPVILIVIGGLVLYGAWTRRSEP